MKSVTILWSRLARVAVVFCAVVAGTIASPALPSAAKARGNGHLYVLDSYYKAVYRFPLAGDGLPATTSDGTLTLDGAIAPSGLAVDAAGHVFVADPNGWGGAVAEFPAKMGSQQPISLLDLAPCKPDYLKMDAAERLYVHCNADQTIQIFAKASHGDAQAMSVIRPFKNPELASDYAIGSGSELYVLSYAGQVGVYGHPLQNPAAPDAFIAPSGGFEFEFGQTLAYDAVANSLYIEFGPRYGGHWYNVDYTERPVQQRAAGEQWLLTSDCGNQQWAGVLGTVIEQSYLIESCAASGSVFVYRTGQFGKRRTVETVVRNIYPYEVAIGP
jgi:hypothetical protein